MFFYSYHEERSNAGSNSTDGKDDNIIVYDSGIHRFFTKCLQESHGNIRLLISKTTEIRALIKDGQSIYVDNYSKISGKASNVVIQTAEERNKIIKSGLQ